MMSGQKKIKILQFPMRDLLIGGVQQYVIRNWQSIDKSRFQFDLATCDTSLSYADLFTSYGSKVQYISSRWEYDPEKFNKEFEKILDEEYDVIHLHTGYWRGFAAEEAAIRKGVPKIIVHAHNSGFNITHDPRSMEQIQTSHEEWRSKFNESLATHFCAASQAAADFLYGEQIPCNRIQIMPNAIDIDKFAYNSSVREMYRNELGLAGKFVIGNVGRFEYQKNHDFLIDVFTEVTHLISNAVLLLVGDGTLQNEIRKKVDKLNLSKRVIFLGARLDVAGLYQAMDIYAHTSWFESLGIVLIESQCAGLPTITSTLLPENAITDNIVGLPFDIEHWRDQIVSIAQSGYERCNRAADVAKAGYSIKEQINELERIYSGEI